MIILKVCKNRNDKIIVVIMIRKKGVWNNNKGDISNAHINQKRLAMLFMIKCCCAWNKHCSGSSRWRAYIFQGVGSVKIRGRQNNSAYQRNKEFYSNPKS